MREVLKYLLLLVSVSLAEVQPVMADTLRIAGIVGSGQIRQTWEKLVGRFEKQSGHAVEILPAAVNYDELRANEKESLEKRDQTIDLFVMDMIWMPEQAHHLLDLTDPGRSLVDQSFPAAAASLTIDGHVMALPLNVDAPALYYRKDLLARYKKPAPSTWSEMEATAEEIMTQERARGRTGLWGYVWQGTASEALTCNAMEWLASGGAGHLIDADGSISVNDGVAPFILDRAANWIGTISPPDVTEMDEEASRMVWNEGNAVFMRNWPYAYALSEEKSSPVRGKFGIVPMPAGDEPGNVHAAVLGGWVVAVSRYSRHQKAATDLALFLASAEAQKQRAIDHAALPAQPALYKDKQIIASQPVLSRWKRIVETSIARPASLATVKYSEVSKEILISVHRVLKTEISAKDAVQVLSQRLKTIKGASWLQGTPFAEYAAQLPRRSDPPMPHIK